MRLAASNIAWEPDQDEAAARLLAEAGATGVEVAPGLLFDDAASATEREIRDARQRWAERGLTIVAVQALLFGHDELRLFEDAESRDAMASYLRHMTRVAAGLGAGAMVFGSPRNRARGELPMPRAESIAAEFFAEAGRYAHAHGTTLCLEANAADYGCDFVCRTEEAVALVTRVDEPGFRVQIDTSTMAMNGEDYAHAIRDAVPLAGHLHISEPGLGPVSADGDVPIDDVRYAIQAAGYDGWVSIEMRAQGGERNIEALRRALDAVTGAPRETGA